MSAAPTVISAGRLYADLIFSGLHEMPALGTEHFAEKLSLHPGGGAAITAAHLAAEGCHAILMATLPTPPFDKAIAPTIKAYGVDMKLCKSAAKGCDPQLTVAISTPEDRAFLTRRAGAAVPKPNLRTFKSSGARHLHIAELSTLVEQPDLLKLARRAGMTVSLDCSWNEAQFSRDVADLIAGVDIFFPSLGELEALRNAGLLLPLAPVTVVKNGEQGAQMFGEMGEFSVSAVKSKVVDTTGAGDAFDGGFLAAWLQGKDPEACLAAGARAGACAVSAVGGLGALTPKSPRSR